MVVENDARVKIVRRRAASVRVVFNAAERWILVLADYAGPAALADGRVDQTYHYRDVAGTWPLAARWEGAATIEEYSMVGQSSAGLGIATQAGLVQVLRLQEFKDANAAAVLTSRGGAGSAGNIGDLSFDAAERWYSEQLRRTDGVMESPGSVVSGKLSMAVAGGVSGGREDGVSRAPNGAVRVGGRVRPPVKVVDVPGVRPEMAVRANARGVVVVEVTIDVDGTVKEARVLRSLPLLDAAALEAVRQWRYEPTILDGKPVPVILTAYVTF